MQGICKGGIALPFRKFLLGSFNLLSYPKRMGFLIFKGFLFGGFT